MASGRSRRSGSEDPRARRNAQFAQINTILEASTTRLAELRKNKAQCELLRSVADGLYEEVDKVSKKSPAETVTTLVLEEVNHLVTQVKVLGGEDPFIQRLREFVPAGERPEHRDAVVVLKLVLQGLDRVAKSLSSLADREGSRSREARLVNVALEYFLEYGEAPTKDALEDLGQSAPDSWITPYPDRAFDFDRLDRMNIDVYFARDVEESQESEEE